MKKAQNGDKEAFLALVQEQELPLYRAAKAVLRREADVEDAVQEAVLRAFYKIGDLRQPKYFKTWLTRILLNCCYDLLRTQRGIVPLELVKDMEKAANLGKIVPGNRARMYVEDGEFYFYVWLDDPQCIHIDTNDGEDD